MKRFLSFILTVTVFFSICAFNMTASAALSYSDTSVTEDFESGKIDTKLWRDMGSNKIEIAPIDSDAGSTNLSYKIGKANFDMNGSKNTFNVNTKLVLDWDIYIANGNIDYGFLAFICKDGAATRETDATGMLVYNYQTNTIGINKLKNNSGSNVTPSNTTSVALKTDEWNKLRVVVDMQDYTFRTIVNGQTISDTGGNVDFKIPFNSMPSSKEVGVNNVRLRLQSAWTGDFYIDNVSYKQYNPPSLIDSTIKENDVVNASYVELGMDFDLDVEALDIKLNDIPVSSDAIKQNSKRKLTCYLDDLSWNTSYCLKGTVWALYNTKKEFTINFTTPPQPEQLIEAAGFYNEGGDKLFALSSGEVSAKVKIWQGAEEKTYTVVAGLYKKIGDAVEMLSLKSADYTLTASAVKTITIDVPAQIENCFVKIYVLNNSTQRTPYQQSLFKGNRILE